MLVAGTSFVLVTCLVAQPASAYWHDSAQHSAYEATASARVIAADARPVDDEAIIFSAQPEPDAQAIRCTLTSHWPHESGHVAGTVNGAATLECTFEGGGAAPVSSLEITVSLFRFEVVGLTWVRVAGPETSSNVGKSSIKDNAATDCVAGIYQTRATGTSVPPPGYQPPIGHHNHDSMPREVDCIPETPPPPCIPGLPCAAVDE